MAHGPIIEYENQEQLAASLKEWQERLFLTDWIIVAYTVPELEITGDAGICKSTRKSRIARISIADSIDSEFPIKLCQEYILVHELLHLAIPKKTMNTDTLEYLFYDNEQHARLDLLAKSLIMTKYGIGFDWFKNF